jgi:hypothetical protein
MRRGLIISLISILVVIALLMQGIGGWLNMTGQESTVLRITSEHAWNDGMFLLVFAILITVLYRG